MGGKGRGKDEEETAPCIQLFSLAETPQPLPPHLGSYTRALLVSQDRQHLFETPWRRGEQFCEGEG